MVLKQLIPWREILFYPKDHIPQAPIYLVGTIHRARAKAPLLSELLEHLKPTLLTVEISPYSWRLRQKYAPLWLERFDNLVRELRLPRSHPALRLYQETLRLPYEVEVAEKFARQRKVPLIPIDSNLIAKKLLQELLQGLNPQNLQKLAQGPQPLLWEQEESLVRFLLRTGLWPTSTEEDQLREVRMARLLRRLCPQRRPIVHIGGWRHLPGLLQRLPEAVGLFLGKEEADHAPESSG